MLRKLLVVALAATFTWTAFAQIQSSRLPSAQGVTPSVSTPCAELFDFQPLVVYDVTGSTIAGPVHRHLAVYSSGAVSYVDIPLDPANTNALSFNVPPLAAFTLLSDLADAGAFELCDGHENATDTPFKTITVFGPFTTNTFSYLTGTGFSGVQAVIDDFIATYAAF